MAKHRYKDKLAKVPKGHVIPKVLRDVGAWVATQERGSLGWFDAIGAQLLPTMEDIDADAAKRLRASGFAFIELGDGSLVSLLTHTKGAPPAVVLVGSDGGYETLAPSLEKFLLDWSRGKSGSADLDPDPDDEAPSNVADARPVFKAWLNKKNVTAPKAKKFNIAKWLEGDKPKAPKEKSLPVPRPLRKRVLTSEMKALPPKLARLASIVGCRADDPEVVEFFRKELKEKPPGATDEMYWNVSAKRAGVEFQLLYEVKRKDTPVIAATSTLFLPYLAYAWAYEEFCEPPFGLTWKTNAALLTSALGPQLPDPYDKYVIPTWKWSMGNDVELFISVSDKGKRKDQLRINLALSKA